MINMQYERIMNNMRKYLFLLVIGICFLTACGKNDKKEDAVVNNTENIIAENENGTEIEVSTESVSDIETTEKEDAVEVIVSSYTYSDLNKTMYASAEVNVRDLPTTDGNKLGELSKAQEIVVTGQCNETGWYRIEYNGVVAYVSNGYLVDTKPVEDTVTNSNGDTNAQPSNGNTWYDEEGFYYCITDTWSTPNETFYWGYIISPVTGFKIILEDIQLEIGSNRLRKELANAGYYVPICIDDGNGYYHYCMLIENPDESWEYSEQLREYALSQGGEWRQGGGNWSDIKDTNGNTAYLLHEYVQR